MAPLLPRTAPRLAGGLLGPRVPPPGWKTRAVHSFGMFNFFEHETILNTCHRWSQRS